MDWLRSWDERILAWFRDQWGTRLDAVILDLTTAGGASVLIMLTAFAVGLLLVLGRQRTALFVLLVVVGGALLSFGAKQVVSRGRPATMHPDVPFPPTTWSFPSGHSMNSAVVYLTLAFVAATPLTRRRGRIYVVSCALLLVFLIGLSRIYLNVHYATDVLAGWTGGLAWALACRTVEDWWEPLRQEELQGVGNAAEAAA